MRKPHGLGAGGCHVLYKHVSMSCSCVHPTAGVGDVHSVGHMRVWPAKALGQLVNV